MRRPSPGLLLFFLLLALAGLPGCWDSQRLEQRAIVIGLGIDPGPHGLLKISTNNPVFEPPDVAPDRMQRITTLAPSLVAALDNLNKVSDKRFSVGQMRVVLFNREVAKTNGIGMMVHDLMHNPIISQITSLAVVEGSCQEMLNLKLKDKTRLAHYVSGLLADAYKRRIIQRSELLFINSQLHNPLAVTMLPYLKYGETEIKVAGQAVFKHEKLAVVIDAEESGLVQAVTGNASNFMFTAPLGPQNVITARIVSNKTRRQWRWQDDKPVFKMDLDLQVDLIGRYSGRHIEDEKAFKDLENKLARYLEDRYRRLAAFSQDKNIDIFQLGVLVRQQLGQQLTPELWDSIYPFVEIEINPVVQIRRIGRTV